MYVLRGIITVFYLQLIFFLINVDGYKLWLDPKKICLFSP